MFWTWSALSASRIAVMNDPGARERGVISLDWQTANDNGRARAVSERVGGRRDERWVGYSIAI